MNDEAATNMTEVKAFDYIEEANVTASNNFHGDMVPLYWFRGVVSTAIKAIEQLDAIKKTLFYGRELTGVPEHHTVTTGCQHLPGMVDPEDLKRGELLLHSIVGTVTEAGEQLEMLSNVLFNGAKFDEVNFIEEVGDGFWYAAVGLKQVGANFGDVQHRNIAKLRHRFPQKFTEYDANNRDLFGERRILEMQGEGVHVAFQADQDALVMLKKFDEHTDSIICQFNTSEDKRQAWNHSYSRVINRAAKLAEQNGRLIVNVSDVSQAVTEEKEYLKKFDTR